MGFLMPANAFFSHLRGLGILWPLDFGTGIGGLRAGVGGALRVEDKRHCPTVLYCTSAPHKYTRERAEVEICFWKNFGLGWGAWAAGGGQRQQGRTAL